MEALLNTQSGLLGISGLTNDMRVLLEESAMHEDHRVRAAIDVFCYRARKYIGSFLRLWVAQMPWCLREGSARMLLLFANGSVEEWNGQGSILTCDRNQALKSEGAITR